MRPRPPSSTLFPYTTLFRSDGDRGRRTGKFFHQHPANARLHHDGRLTGIRRASGSERVFHARLEEHTSELQSQSNLVCRLLLEKKKKKIKNSLIHKLEHTNC